MKFKVFIISLIFLLYSCIVEADPDNVADFGNEAFQSANFTFPDLTFLKKAAFVGPGGSQHPANVGLFPGIKSLGVSGVILRFNHCGINTPHTHPRATETQYLVQGKVVFGFVDTQGRYFANIANAGDVFVFPRGMLHFEMNVGNKPAMGLALFNAELPGASFINEAYQKLPLSSVATSFGQSHMLAKQVLKTANRQISLDLACLDATKKGKLNEYIKQTLEGRVL